MDRRHFLASATAFSALMSLARVKPARAALDEFCHIDGMGQAELVASGQVSPTELANAAIKRIEKLNPILNAVVHKLYDEGREAAANPLPEGPFKGVPYLIKDLSELNGAPLTLGSRLFAHNVADRDNGSVVRAKAAGLVIIGKTNTPEFGFISTTNPISSALRATPITPPTILAAAVAARRRQWPLAWCPLLMPPMVAVPSAYQHPFAVSLD